MLDEEKIKQLTKGLQDRLLTKKVVAINEKGDYRIYDSANKAAKELGVARQSISMVLKKEQLYSKNIKFVYAHEVSKRYIEGFSYFNKDGEIILDENAIKKAY